MRSAPMTALAALFTADGYAAAPGMPDGGKFTLTLRRGTDGRWWIVSDMDNRNRAAP